MCQNDSETTISQYLIITRNDQSFKKIQISTYKWTTQSQYELYCRNEKKTLKKTIITVFIFLTSLKQDIKKTNYLFVPILKF